MPLLPPRLLPRLEGHWRALQGDDGILNCLRYFREGGALVALCSEDRWLRMRCYDYGIGTGRPQELAAALRAGRHAWRAGDGGW
jgi:hypothetical protein